LAPAAPLRAVRLGAVLLGAALLAGCASEPPPPERGAGPAGILRAVPYAFFPADAPPPSGTYFHNPRLGRYEVARPLDDSAAIIFFDGQEGADGYVRARLAEGRRPGAAFYDAWPPPPLRRGEDFDAFAERSLGPYLDQRLEAIRGGTLGHPDLGDTGLAAFESEMEGRETAHFVYVRHGYAAYGVRRLSVMSANLHFYSVWWGDL